MHNALVKGTGKSIADWALHAEAAHRQGLFEEYHFSHFMLSRGSNDVIAALRISDGERGLKKRYPNLPEFLVDIKAAVPIRVTHSSSINAATFG